jgi:Tol biopolymer transport system component
MKLKIADGTVEPITPNLEKNEFEPAFTTDGSWLATVQSRGNLSMSLVIRQYPTGSEVEIKPEGGFCGYRAPAFTPDGARVYYSFADEERQNIVSVDRDGGNKQFIVRGPGHANWPNLTPDGQQLVFSSTRDGNYEIYAAKPDGTAVRRLTDSPTQDIRPRVSPDGKWIAFTSGRDGNYEIYIMGWDGAPPRRITDNPERDDYPAWHPNSRQLAIVSERSGQHDLYLIDIARDAGER